MAQVLMMVRRRELLAGAASALALTAGCIDTTEDPPTEQPPVDDTPTGSPTDTPADTRSSPVTDDGTESPTETTTDDPSTSTPDETSTPTKTPDDGTMVVEVAPNGELVYSPDTFEVPAGTTVRWEWAGSGHNIVVSSKPDGSDWKGDDAELYNEGHVHEFTFTTPGTYEYYCNPHQSFGMVASFTVTEA